MNYEQMSDFEINKAAAEALGLDWSHVDFDPDSEDPRICIDEYDSFSKEHTGTVADYCNNPADAWPVIEENNIAMFPSYTGEWFAVKSVYIGDTQTAEFEQRDKNPLRAAMIVFLMMQESTK